MAERSARSDAQRVLDALHPIWVVPGILDYVCHRRTRIERTSGTHESLTHLLMTAASGVPVLLSLAFEMTPSVALLAVASVLTHEAIVVWDVAYAAPLRAIPPNEQHVHSFLEVLPFTMLALSVSADPAAFRDIRSGWPLEFTPRRRPPSRAYFSLLATLATISAAAYVEEFVRCYRVDRTIGPHAQSIEDEEDGGAG